jgi:hypothetical protein
MLAKLVRLTLGNALDARKSAIAGTIGAQSIVLGAYVVRLATEAIANTELDLPFAGDVKAKLSTATTQLIGNLCSEIQTEAPKQLDALIAILRR